MATHQTAPVGAITVPAGFISADGNPRLGVKVKRKKGVKPVVASNLIPNMELKPEYSDLYAECFEEASVKHAGKGLREIGAQGWLLSTRRIAAIEKAAAAAVSSKREVKPAMAVSGNLLSDWENAFSSDPAPDQSLSMETGWAEADDGDLEMLKEAAKRPTRPHKPVKPQVIEMRRPVESNEADAWSDGFSRRGSASPAAKTVGKSMRSLTDMFNIPGLSLEPGEATGYALFTVPEGDLRFRFNWVLKDDAADRWVIFVQDSRSDKVTDVRQYLDGIAEGVGELRMASDPTELEVADMTMTDTTVNSFKFGDFTFLQFFLVE